MDRFPKHYHETSEQPVLCFRCGVRLNEDEEAEYYSHIHYSSADPTCDDCQQEQTAMDTDKEHEWDDPIRPRHYFSGAMFLCFVACFAVAVIDRSDAGGLIMVGVGCLSFGLLLRICRL